MAQSHADVVARIQQTIAQAREMHETAMDLDAPSIEARLEQTTRELQARVKEQQAALEQLRRSSGADIEQAGYASQDPRKKLKQLLVVKHAYEKLNETTPFLPSSDSVLPTFLVTRALQQNIQGTKQAIATVEAQIKITEDSLRREEANRQDARLILASLSSRRARLDADIENRSRKNPDQLAKELIAAKRARKEKYDEETQRLEDAINDFINDYLSPMLAAEELGGPVVGDMLQVENETLAAGFTKKGKAKSTKKPLSDKTRQRRIDQIWGKSVPIEDEDEEPLTEAEAADHEMRTLLENLFVTLNGPGRGTMYYDLERDSAASRFLVRAKVAQFHPKDARRLRLIDFGRELDE